MSAAHHPMLLMLVVLVLVVVVQLVLLVFVLVLVVVVLPLLVLLLLLLVLLLLLPPLALHCPRTAAGHSFSCCARRHCSQNKCSVVRTYTGHGINSLFHTAPNVPHYAKNKAVGMMHPGQTFTIEPMVNAGASKDFTWPDDWTAVSQVRICLKLTQIYADLCADLGSF